MDVLLCTSVPPRLKGFVTRWMVEVGSGVFVGNMSARVRDLLWELAVEESGEGTVILVTKSNSVTGFTVRSHGPSIRRIVDFDGLLLPVFDRGDPD